MREYIYVYMIDKQPVGSTFKFVPLHMTALHWFSTEKNPKTIISATTAVLQDLTKISTYATEEAMFGPDKDVPVMKLDRTSELINLHLKLVKAMQSLSVIFDERWTGEVKWYPHVTHKTDIRLYPGDQVLVSDIDLIMRERVDSDRIILERFNLN